MLRTYTKDDVMKNTDDRATFTMVVRVIAPPGVSMEKAAQQILESEMMLNDKTKLRFHFGELKQVK
jgi:hypothetical protein